MSRKSISPLLAKGQIFFLLLSILELGIIDRCLGFTSPPKATNNPIFQRQPKQQLQQQEPSSFQHGGSTQRYIFGLDKEQSTKSAAGNVNEDQVAYIIERIGNDNSGNERIFKEVAEVCINVFFKEQLDAKPEDRIPPWKEAQISYLKTLQTGDLKLRRTRYQENNEMFLAYEVIPASSSDGSWNKNPLIVEPEKIYNLPSNSNYNDDFVRGRLLGFCEITQRQYGLGKDGGSKNNRNNDTYRPVLTNLAVAADVRKYGIGSKLVDECERKAGLEWQMNEIVLEVEDYNDAALNFYIKRGYDVVFNDPASRRYDVGGIMLKKVRCTRQILRKSLSQKSAQLAGQDAVVSMPSFDFFQRFRQVSVRV